MANNLQDWWTAAGPVTRHTLMGCVGCTVLATLGVFEPHQLMLHWPSVWQHLEVWRPVTTFLFVGPLSGPNALSTVLNTGFLANFSRSVEDLVFPHQLAEHVFFLTVVSVICLVVAYVLHMHMLFSAFTMALLWVYCRRISTIFNLFGIDVPSDYFPFVILGFNYVMGGDIVGYCIGLGAAQCYLSLKDDLPRMQNLHLLPTPSIFFTLFPSTANTHPASAQSQPQVQEHQPPLEPSTHQQAFHRFQPGQPAATAEASARFRGAGRRLDD